MIQPIETHYDGCRFRSRTEARWAVFFNNIGLRYEYEKEGYALPSGWYLPDFFLPEIGYWFEVKGQQPTGDEISACGWLNMTTDYPVLIASGAPEPRAQLLHVPIVMTPEETYRGSGSLEPRFFFAEDRRNPREFWLWDGDMTAHSVGPRFGPDHGKLPGVFAVMGEAYRAARSARFERFARKEAAHHAAH